VGEEEDETRHKPPEKDTMSPPERKRLRPAPRSAPRSIEKTGRYTIRKGVRIRDYNVPLRRQDSTPSSTSGLEFQCRDGFTEDEAFEWRPYVERKRTADPRTWSLSAGSPALVMDQLPLHIKKAECESVTDLSAAKADPEIDASDDSMRACKEAEG
jgi:hypothetical protein